METTSCIIKSHCFLPDVVRLYSKGISGGLFVCLFVFSLKMSSVQNNVFEKRTDVICVADNDDKLLQFLSPKILLAS